jgi:hypothetical protein
LTNVTTLAASAAFGEPAVVAWVGVVGEGGGGAGGPGGCSEDALTLLLDVEAALDEEDDAADDDEDALLDVDELAEAGPDNAVAVFAGASLPVCLTWLLAPL